MKTALDMASGRRLSMTAPFSAELTGWTLGTWHESESRGRLGYFTIDLPDHVSAIRVYGDSDEAERLAHFIAHAPRVAALPWLTICETGVK